jgi:hypothetical protein
MQPSPALPSGDARIAELMRAYLAAEYRWELDGEWLNLRIGEDAPAPRERYPDARCFGLISAWDPYSIPRPDSVNRAADEALRQDLQASGCAYRAAFSSASNRAWREPGWLVVDMPVAEFDALSRRYGQLATLYWPAQAPVRMRVDAAAPFACTAYDAIDWLKA